MRPLGALSLEERGPMPMAHGTLLPPPPNCARVDDLNPVLPHTKEYSP